ncbi:MAG: alpha/beta hydrolase [Hamadaea sp.]|nr:alpha/beta hydrolase [Hamadaea sp.]
MAPELGTDAYYAAEAKVFGHYGLQPRSGMLALTEPHLRIRTVEVGSGEPVLLLHGFSLCTAQWAPLMSRLPGLRLIAIDMPGHGGSDPVDYTGTDLRQWYRRVLTAILDGLQLDRVHLVGHSQGAMLALFLALDAPDRVRSVTAVGTPAVAFGARLPSLRVLARPGLGPLLLSMPKPDPMYRRILRDSVGEHALATMPTDLVRATYLATRRPGFGSTVSSYLREMFRGLDAQPQRYVLADDELARVRPPVSVLLGMQESRFQDLDEAARRVALIPGARFATVAGDHEPWLDDLDTCAAYISAALIMN